MIDFQLKPFPQVERLPEIQLIGKIDRQEHIYSINYQLLGDLSSVEIPALATIPIRKFALWESTCFEFFIGIPGNSNYWEFNLSPSGDWNIFHFDGYRQGLRNELAFESLPVKIDRQSLSLSLDLTNIIPASTPIEVSVTTVIKPVHGEISYWALTHIGSEPDFHLRDSFIIRM